MLGLMEEGRRKRGRKGGGRGRRERREGKEGGDEVGEGGRGRRGHGGCSSETLGSFISCVLIHDVEPAAWNQHNDIITCMLSGTYNDQDSSATS